MSSVSAGQEAVAVRVPASASSAYVFITPRSATDGLVMDGIWDSIRDSIRKSNCNRREKQLQSMERVDILVI